jgi:hypothetical protein
MPGGDAAFLKLHFTGVILPAYKKQYPATSNLPAELTIYEGDNSINGDGAQNYVAVTEGVAKEKSYAMRVFALAHETGHSVTMDEFQSHGKTAYYPMGADAKLWEYIADIIGMRMLKAQLPAQADAVMGEIGYLASWLGPGDNMHPDGNKRAELLQKCYRSNSFDTLFNALAIKQIP